MSWRLPACPRRSSRKGSGLPNGMCGGSPRRSKWSRPRLRSPTARSWVPSSGCSRRWGTRGLVDAVFSEVALQLARKLELASGRDAPALAARLADVLRELRVLEAPDHVDALRAGGREVVRERPQFGRRELGGDLSPEHLQREAGVAARKNDATVSGEVRTSGPTSVTEPGPPASNPLCDAPGLHSRLEPP